MFCLYPRLALEAGGIPPFDRLPKILCSTDVSYRFVWCCAEYFFATRTQNERSAHRAASRSRHNTTRSDVIEQYDTMPACLPTLKRLRPSPVFFVMAQCHLALRVSILIKNFLVLLVATCYLWRPYLQRVQVGTLTFVQYRCTAVELLLYVVMVMMMVMSFWISKLTRF